MSGIRARKYLKARINNESACLAEALGSVLERRQYRQSFSSCLFYELGEAVIELGQRHSGKVLECLFPAFFF